MEWIKMQDEHPDDGDEIIFIAKEGKTTERIGIYNKGIIMLRRTDLYAADVLFWCAIPKMQTCRHCEKPDAIITEDTCCTGCSKLKEKI